MYIYFLLIYILYHNILKSKYPYVLNIKSKRKFFKWVLQFFLTSVNLSFLNPTKTYELLILQYNKVTLPFFQNMRTAFAICLALEILLLQNILNQLKFVNFLVLIFFLIWIRRRGKNITITGKMICCLDFHSAMRCTCEKKT